MLENNLHFEHLIQQIIFLLKNNHCEDWVTVFKELLHDCNTKQRSDLAKKILNIYGGMGSFNDLILQKNHKMLVEENDSLDKLKDGLYEICKLYIIRDADGNIIV